MADEGEGEAVKNLREDPDATTSEVEDEEEEDGEGFTFAAATRLPGGGAYFGDGGGVIGRVYPVFGRPRSPPPPRPSEEDAGTATIRVPLRQLLLAERGGSSSSSSQQQSEDEEGDGGGELDGVPAETYCLWSPGTSPSPSPARCPKSGSTGSVLRWRQRLQVGRSHSDGKEKFVFLQQEGTPGSSSSSPGRKGGAGDSPAGAGGFHGWSYYGGTGRGSGRGSRRSSPTFLPYKQDLVGLFANAGALRRSYHPF